MTEPEEALLYGEKFSTVPWIQLVTAQAYRAGAAASDARIRALEDEVTALAVDLSQLIYLVECDGHNGDHQGCAVCEDIANIRAEMKEADQ